jgi:hypothetical protein
VEHLAVRRDGRRQIVEPELVDLAEAVLELEDVVGRLADLRLAAAWFSGSTSRTRR